MPKICYLCQIKDESNLASMDIMEFREYCLSLPEVEECTPFDEFTLVYKVSGRMFACAFMERADHFVVKCDPDWAIELRDAHSEITPAWHFNKRHWNDVSFTGDLSEQMLRRLICHSYMLVIAKNVTPRAERVRLQKIALDSGLTL